MAKNNVKAIAATIPVTQLQALVAMVCIREGDKMIKRGKIQLIGKVKLDRHLAAVEFLDRKCNFINEIEYQVTGERKMDSGKWL